MGGLGRWNRAPAFTMRMDEEAPVVIRPHNNPDAEFELGGTRT